jgi:hypothetical protein
VLTKIQKDGCHGEESHPEAIPSGRSCHSEASVFCWLWQSPQDARILFEDPTIDLGAEAEFHSAWLARSDRSSKEGQLPEEADLLDLMLLKRLTKN